MPTTTRPSLRRARAPSPAASSARRSRIESRSSRLSKPEGETRPASELTAAASFSSRQRCVEADAVRTSFEASLAEVSSSPCSSSLTSEPLPSRPSPTRAARSASDAASMSFCCRSRSSVTSVAAFADHHRYSIPFSSKYRDQASLSSSLSRSALFSSNMVFLRPASSSFTNASRSGQR